MNNNLESLRVRRILIIIEILRMDLGDRLIIIGWDLFLEKGLESQLRSITVDNMRIMMEWDFKISIEWTSIRKSTIRIILIRTFYHQVIITQNRWTNRRKVYKRFRIVMLWLRCPRKWQTKETIG